MFTIERESDPQFPNRNFYLIKSETRGGVQAGIDYLMAEVESFGNGTADFWNPRRHQSGVFFSIGETVIHPDLYEARP